MHQHKRQKRRWNYRIGFPIMLFLAGTIDAQQQQDPTTLNGGSVLAMAGDGCVALAVDKRFGSGPQMVNVAPRHVLAPHPHAMIAFTGLEGDIQSLSQELRVQSKPRPSLLLLNDDEDDDTDSVPPHLEPRALSSLTSHILYRRRRSPFFVEPVVIGLRKQQQSTHDAPSLDGEAPNQSSGNCVPYLCTQDIIGAESQSKSFVCAGVAAPSLYGIAEALWRPGLSPQELVQVCGKAFLSALERDCLSGYGATLYLMTADRGIEEIDLVCRND